jgi:hypothetical protein
MINVKITLTFFLLIVILSCVYSRCNPVCPYDGGNTMWIATKYNDTMRCRTVQVYKCLLCNRVFDVCDDN